MIIRDITEPRATEAERERWIHELKEALGRLKSLSSLLPRCAPCRKDPWSKRIVARPGDLHPGPHGSGLQSRNLPGLPAEALPWDHSPL